MMTHCLTHDGGLANTYVLQENEREYVVIDPSDYDILKDCVVEFSGKICYVFLTHEHWDHIAGLNQLRNECDVKVYSTTYCSKAIQSEKLNLSKYSSVLHKENAGIEMPFVCEGADTVFSGEFQLQIGNSKIKLIETPGHSPGSCCIRIGKRLFAGDTVLECVEDIFRMPRHDLTVYRERTLPLLKKMNVENKDLVLYPGHGKELLLRDMIDLITKYLEVNK